MANVMQPQAVLWDFDGTLMDSESIWVQSEIEIANELGFRWTEEDGARISGMSWQLATAEMTAAAEADGVTLPMDAKSLYTQLYLRVAEHLTATEPTWITGSRELVLALADQGVPMALVSASPMEVLEAGVTALPEGTFDAIIHGQMVTHGKPHPESYLTAAHKLGFEAPQCIALEDSHSGTASALDSGAVVVKVKSLHEVADHPRLTRVDNFANVDWSWLARTYQELAHRE